MNIDIDKDRAAFSEWAKSENFNTNWHSVAKFFTSTDTQVRWEVWQAARATPLAPTPAAAELPKGWQAVPKVLRQPMSEAIGRAISLGSNQHLWDCALAAAPLPRQAAVRGADTERLDWLEQRGNDGGLLLHAGNQDTGGHSGLGLINTGRTLRQAVDSARGIKAAKSAPATTEKEAP